jgi:hypothetical protein
MEARIHYFVIGKQYARDLLRSRHSFNAKYKKEINIGDEIVFSKVAEDDLPYAIEKKYFNLAEDEKLTKMFSNKIYKVVNVSNFYGHDIYTITIRKVKVV